MFYFVNSREDPGNAEACFAEQGLVQFVQVFQCLEPVTDSTVIMGIDDTGYDAPVTEINDFFIDRSFDKTGKTAVFNTDDAVFHAIGRVDAG